MTGKKGDANSTRKYLTLKTNFAFEDVVITLDMTKRG